MAPREVVALVRAAPFRARLSPPALPSLPSLPLLRRPSARAVVVVAALAAVLAGAYLVARATSLFAVHEVAVAGSSPSVTDDVRAVLDLHVGSSLVALDAGALEARLRAIPSVRAASVDRAFPHTLAVTLEAERPLAVVPDGEGAWLVAASGRVLEEVEPAARPRLARVHVRFERPPEPGATLTDPPAAVALGALDSLPRRLARDTRFARVVGGQVVLVLADGVEVRLGGSRPLDANSAAAAAVLRALPADERAGITYVDATVPERVVVGSGAEPSVEGLEYGDEVPGN